MTSFFRTAAVAIVSSATTAALFIACAPEIPARQAQPAPADSTIPAPAPTLAALAPQPASTRPNSVAVASAQALGNVNPAVLVHQQHGQSVVNITSLAVVRNRLGQQMGPQQRGVGTGFIIDSDGRIVTNNHVVEDAAQLSVAFFDRTVVPAQLVGRDPDNDLAVIQIDVNGVDDAGTPVRERIRPVSLGDSDQVVVGETAIAIGSPLGLQQTVTQGIISARRNPGDESAQGAIDILGGAIQTDASVNPGNSGGPLFNANGQVIGVNTAILSQSGGNEGIGFAIPINVVRRVAPELIQSGRYRHPQVGVTSVSLAELSPAVKQQLGLPANQKGLLVQSVTAGAQQAGLQAGTRRVTVGGEALQAGGDIVVAIDGQPVATGGDLRGWIENQKRPGETVVVTVLRNGERVDVTVTLSERQATPAKP